MDGIPFHLPISSQALIIIGVVALVVILVVFLSIRGVRGRSGSKDFVIVIRSDGTARSYPLNPVVPPTLYTYDCGVSDLCYFLADAKPIIFYDGKSFKNMYIAVESDLLSIAIKPEDVELMSSLATSVKEASSDDIVNLVMYMLSKKSEDHVIRIPPRIKVALSYKYDPAGVKVIEDLFRRDASAFTVLVSSLRSAGVARELAMSYAIRAGAQVRRLQTIGTVIAIIVIALAVAYLLMSAR